MKKLFLISVVGLMSTSAFADADLSIDCVSSETGASIQGTVNANSGQLTIMDPQQKLGIYAADAGLSNPYRFDRSLRKNEAKYAFAGYATDASAWQNFVFTLPKQILVREDHRFVACFTVETDDGDRMVPGESIKFSCTTR